MGDVFELDVHPWIKELERFGKVTPGAEREAIQAGGERFKDRLQRNTPIGNDYRSSMNGLKMHQDIDLSNILKDGAGLALGDLAVKVGYVKGGRQHTAWRAHFPEFGTSYQRPQGFTQRTVQQAEKEILQIMGEVWLEKMAIKGHL
ncbi:MAG: hypothetical protein LBV67_04580 [Streptococcaceae bacterium]|jgi:HK97 gp10 family phage protein|nr:hypothetical protein [Streptococcaceae bacterium]